MNSTRSSTLQPYQGTWYYVDYASHTSRHTGSNYKLDLVVASLVQVLYSACTVSTCYVFVLLATFRQLRSTRELFV